MSYEILRRYPGRGTIVVRYDNGRKAHIRLPAAREGTPEFDAEVEKYERATKDPDWPAVKAFRLNYGGWEEGEPSFRRTMPIHDRRR